MDSARWSRIKGIFHEAIERAPSQRDAFVQNACGGDADLLRDVSRLLELHVGSDTFLETPALASATLAESATDFLENNGPVLPVGTVVGGFEIIEHLGRGGMGVVYKARQDHPERIVALKLIRPGSASEQILRRFQNEAQVLGRLQHPGIAQIYDAGTARTRDGIQPYLAMEFIDGESLNAYCKSRELSVSSRIELMAAVCDAIHHAHQKGVVHRDLKPGNILVTRHAQPKVLDFGVARLTDVDVHTATLKTDAGQFLGTLPYMSPEQVTGDPLAIEVRSDVYALGVILFEILTGELPFDCAGKSLVQAARIITERPAPKLGAIRQQYSGDIELIVGKALAKDKEQRYDSAASLASDLRRYLQHEPIVAAPPSALYRMRKFARRHQLAVTLSAALTTTIIAGAVISAWGWLEASKNERLAIDSATQSQAQEKAAQEAREIAIAESDKNRAISDFLIELFTSPKPDEDGREVRVVDVLQRAVSRLDESMSDQPERRAVLRSTIGHSFQALGMHEEARQQFKLVLKNSRESFGDDDKKTLDAKSNYAVALEYEGRYAEAEKLLQQLVEKRSAIEGVDANSTLIERGNYGRIFLLQGKSLDAVQVLSEVLPLLRTTLGIEERETTSAMHNLALALHDLGRYEESESLVRELLEVRSGQVGSNHTTLLATRDLLCLLLKAQDKLDEAEAMSRETLNIRRQVQGPEHPDTLTTLGNLALLVWNQGDLPESERLQREVLELRRKSLGPDHDYTLLSLHHLASVIYSQGRIDEGRDMMIECLERQTRSLGEEHVASIQSAMLLAKWWMVEDELERAEPLLRTVLQGRTKSLGSGHVRTLLTKWLLASNLHNQGFGEEPQNLLVSALGEFDKENHGIPAKVNRILLTELASMLIDRNELDRAQPYIQQALEMLDEDPNRAPDRDSINAKRLDCILKLAHGPVAEAERCLADLLDVTTNSLPESSVAVAEVRASLGECLYLSGNTVQAAIQLELALDVLVEEHPSPRHQINRAARFLAKTYSALGESSKADRATRLSAQYSTVLQE